VELIQFKLIRTRILWSHRYSETIVFRFMQLTFGANLPNYHYGQLHTGILLRHLCSFSPFATLQDFYDNSIYSDDKLFFLFFRINAVFFLAARYVSLQS
jgi:hypothetical protein